MLVRRVVKTLRNLCPVALFMIDSNGDLPLNIAKQTERGSKEVSDALLQWTFEELRKHNDNVSTNLQVSSKFWPSTYVHTYVESCRHMMLVNLL